MATKLPVSPSVQRLEPIYYHIQTLLDPKSLPTKVRQAGNALRMDPWLNTLVNPTLLPMTGYTLKEFVSRELRSKLDQSLDWRTFLPDLIQTLLHHYFGIYNDRPTLPIDGQFLPQRPTAD